MPSDSNRAQMHLYLFHCSCSCMCELALQLSIVCAGSCPTELTKCSSHSVSLSLPLSPRSLSLFIQFAANFIVGYGFGSCLINGLAAQERSLLCSQQQYIHLMYSFILKTQLQVDLNRSRIRILVRLKLSLISSSVYHQSMRDKSTILHSSRSYALYGTLC